MTLEDAQLLLTLKAINTDDEEFKEALEIANQYINVVIKIPEITGMSIKDLINEHKLDNHPRRVDRR